MTSLPSSSSFTFNPRPRPRPPRRNSAQAGLPKSGRFRRTKRFRQSFSHVGPFNFSLSPSSPGHSAEESLNYPARASFESYFSSISAPSGRSVHEGGVSPAMAYAYPSGADPSASSTSLSSPHGHGGVGGQGQEKGRESISGSRKSSDDKFDISKEFKAKIDEDTNYLQFFQDRIKVEEEYVAGLKRIYSRSKAIDTLHDDAFRRGEKPTTRRAWDEVRDYTQREIQAKEALVGALKEVVIKELVRLKEEQGRIRMGLKENMKHANEMYDEHAKNQLPRIRKNYVQKCQALEDHKRQEHAIAMQAKLLADSSTSPLSTPLKEHPNSITAAGGPFSALSPPTSTPALPPSSNPTQVPEAQSSREADKKHGRLRAGSASGQDKTKEVFNDLAAQSKKGFNAIMQRLGGDKGDKEEGGFVMVPSAETEGLQRRGTTARGDPTRGMGTMRGVKVKRDADEADKAYRTAVFHLESLRLRRDKLQTSGARNLEAFNDDLNKALVMALEVYIDTLHGTAATNAQATHVAREAIESVNLDKDMSLFRARLRAVDNQRTAPVPYVNFYVGECRSLIFGVSLTDYDFARGEGGDHGRPPVIVEKCIAAIDEKGLDAEGIYRISGRHAGVQKMIQDVELDEEKFEFDEKDDVFSVSNVLKQYLRELPEPVFNFPHSERAKYTEHRETHIHSNFSALRGRLRRLPNIHQTTFQALVEHLSRIAGKSGVNKMDAKNLAVVFNSVLFGQDQVGIDTNLLTMNQEKDTLLEDLITYADLLFGADDTQQAPHLFPPGAAFTRTGIISDQHQHQENAAQPGSSRTKFKSRSLETPQQAQSHAPNPTVNPVINLDDPPAAAAPATSPMFEGQEPVMALPTFTPDEELELLFDPSAIPSSMREAFPDHHVRPLSSTDLMRSHFGLLQTLSIAPALAPSHYTALFQSLKTSPETYYIVVLIEPKTDQMVGHGTVLVEKKYIHGGSSAAHIEDIVISPECRGGGVGKKLVIGLKDLAVGRGCYKVVLHCKDDKIPFYEKCGFHVRSRGMAYYHTNQDNTPKPTPISPHSATVPPPPPAPVGTHLVAPGPATGPLPTDAEPPEGSPGGTVISASSGSGITYHFPTTTLSPSTLVAPALPPRPAASKRSDSDQAQPQAETSATPAWAAEGLGSSERAVPSPKSASPTEAKEQEGQQQLRSATPLPPGAAPPNLDEEPERIVLPRG